MNTHYHSNTPSTTNAKMCTMKRISVLLMLLTLASGENTDACDFSVHPERERKELCKSVYDIFEDVLLSDPINLFTLREAFFPVSNGASPTASPPEILGVKYNVTINNVFQVNEILGWSNSAVFSLVHPYKLIRTVSKALLRFTLHKHITLALNLTLSAIPKEAIQHPEVFNHTIVALTSRLKVYAKKQEKLGKELDHLHNNMGQVWGAHQEHVGLSYLFSITYAMVILVIELFVCSTVQQFLQLYMEQKRKNIDAAIALFVALGIILFPLNILELIMYNVDGLENSKLELIPIPRHLSFLVFLLRIIGYVLPVVWGVYGFVKANVLPQVPNTWFSKLFGCCCKQKILYIFCLVNISLFTYTFSANILPVCILTYVYPDKAIPALILVTTIFLDFLLILTFFIYHHTRGEVEHQHSLFCVKYEILFSIYTVSTFLLFLYLFLVLLTADESIVYRAVLSIVPPTILGAIAFTAKSFLEQTFIEVEEAHMNEKDNKQHTNKQRKKRKTH